MTGSDGSGVNSVGHRWHWWAMVPDLVICMKA